MAEPKQGWQRVKFGDVVRQVKNKVDPNTAGLSRYVAGEHMDTDDLRIRRWGDIGDDYLGPAFHMRFRPGHVLYGSRRTYLRKVAVADFEGICANTTFVLEPKDASELLPELLPYVMTSTAFHDHSMRESKGSVNPYVNFSDLAWFEFWLPPLMEQRRIAALLKAATEALESARALKATAESLHSSVINEVTLGSMAASPLAILQDLIDPDRPITYGILKPGKGYPNGIPVIKVRDYPNGEIASDDLLLTSPEIDQEYRRSRLRPGDLLISIRGTIGRLAFVPERLNGANITQDTARLSIREGVNPIYIRCLLESSSLRSQIQAGTTGLAVQGLNIGELRRLKLPLPSTQDQNRIAKSWEASRSAIGEASKRTRECATLLRILTDFSALEQ